MIWRFFFAIGLAVVAALWFLGEPDSSVLERQNGKIADIEKELKEMNDTVSRLQAKPRDAGAKTRQEMDRYAKTLQERIQSTQNRLQEFKVSPKTTSARDRLRRALIVIRGWLSRPKENV